MTDRQLIELAAKAAGVKGKWEEVEDGWFIPHDEGGWLSYIRWDPLTNDHHALRLVVKLNLFIFHSWAFAPGENVPYANVVVNNAEQSIPSGEIKGSDPYAATRRAIVRAAAQIGLNT